MFVIQSTRQGASFLTNHFLKYKIEPEFLGFYFIRSRLREIVQVWGYLLELASQKLLVCNIKHPYLRIKKPVVCPLWNEKAYGNAFRVKN